MLNINLTGRRALVCGASQGIGRAIAVELADLGASVIVLARNEAKLKQVVAALKTAGQQQHHFICVDLHDLNQVEQLIHDEIKQHGPVEILVNNSGGPALGAITEATLDDFQRAYDAHLKASVILTNALLPGMQRQHYGRIINITSTSVKTPLKNLGVSNTTRWAVAAWAKTLANEIAQDGITVNTILPGSIKTERNDAHIDYLAQKNKIDVAAQRKQVEANVPAGYIGSPQEVAQVVAFLASPAASYVNGVALAVDGGRTPAI